MITTVDIENQIIENQSISENEKRSKIFVKSALITYSLWHESKYKMMCDFIIYYENK